MRLSEDPRYRWLILAAADVVEHSGVLYVGGTPIRTVSQALLTVLGAALSRLNEEEP